MNFILLFKFPYCIVDNSIKMGFEKCVMNKTCSPRPTKQAYLDSLSVGDDVITRGQNEAKGQLLQGRAPRHLQQAEHLQPVVLGQGLPPHPLEDGQHVLGRNSNTNYENSRWSKVKQNCLFPVSDSLLKMATILDFFFD